MSEGASKSFSPPVALQYLPLSTLIMCVASLAFMAPSALTDIVTGFSAVSSPSGAIASNLSIKSAAPVLRVTLGFIMLYFSFLMIQSWSKFYAFHSLKKQGSSGKGPSFNQVKYGNEGNKLTLTGDRSVGNLMEQTPLFLLSLWLHAAFVDPSGAAFWGWLWIVSRSIYPFAFYSGPPYLFASTIPGYLCLSGLVIPVGRLAFGQ
jgi:hypothetical protein